ncbi:MAG: pyruvate kinase [Thermoguttaceae bacterium]
MPDRSTPLPRDSQTKIVATMGPACDSEDKLAELITAGVDVFRLNMAHADHRQQDVRLAMIRNAATSANRTIGVLVDLAGPKIRLGELPGGRLLCNTGDLLRFVRTSPGAQPTTAAPPSDTPVPTTATTPEVTTTYEPLIDELQTGDRIMLADGIVSLVVEKVGKDSAECRVLQSGLIRSRQGVNLPGVKLSVAALNGLDRENAVWAAQNDIDFVGLSFVRRPEDVRELKALLASAGQASGPQVIAKIEKPEALDALSEIVAAADGVMVARGDLGVEIDIAQVGVAQKRIIAECRRQRTPVIIATQMLDSMQHSRLPTRAEVTDVSNAILDGADACMLSSETAVGEYPRETVEMMNRIALAAEPLCSHRAEEAGPCGQSGVSGNTTCATAGDGPNLVTEAVVCQAGLLAEKVSARLIIVASASGATALSLAKNRFRVPTVGVSDSAATLRRMCLYWGIIPLASAPVDDSRTLVAFVSAWGKKNRLLSSGDRIVLVAGTNTAITAHNMIVVHEVE